MNDSRDPTLGMDKTRHWAGFALSGGIAFMLDAGTLLIGVRLFGLSPYIARLLAICVAVVGAWLAHRTFTFAIKEKPTLAEFLRYAAAAWTTAAINYSIFAGLLLAWPALRPIAALVIASILATFFSYVSMRYGVFRRAP